MSVKDFAIQLMIYGFVRINDVNTGYISVITWNTKEDFIVNLPSTYKIVNEFKMSNGSNQFDIKLI